MRHSWGSMLRTVRAAVAVMLLGGVGLTVPPQTRDMLAFLEDGRVWPAISFPIALAVLAGSAWFWSRAALAARFGIDDGQRYGAVPADFNWAAFTWLPRLMLVASFLVGAVIAFMNGSPWTIAGAIALGVFGISTRDRPPSGTAGRAPAGGRYGFRAWIQGGAKARLKALLQRAPFGAAFAMVLLALGLVPLALGVIEAFIYTLRLPNLLAEAFPGPGIAVLLLGLMIGPLVAVTFVFDGLTLQGRVGSHRLGFRRPPVLSLYSPLRVCARTTAVSHPYGSSDRRRHCAASAAQQAFRPMGQDLRARYGPGAADHRCGLGRCDPRRIVGSGSARPSPAGTAAKRPGAVRGQ